MPYTARVHYEKKERVPMDGHKVILTSSCFTDYPDIEYHHIRDDGVVVLINEKLADRDKVVAIIKDYTRIEII